MARLQEMPGIRLLVMINDPVARLERHFLKNMARCRERFPTYDIPKLGECLKAPCGHFCDFRHPDQPWTELQSYTINLEEWKVADHIRKAQTDFGATRVFLADRSFLRHGVRFFN